MRIFAISDLHLSLGVSKPMEVFGPQWKNHDQRIAANWDALVQSDDTVLLAGDHSWALNVREAQPDLDFIASRPGTKALVRGNHDYWWRREATNRLQRSLPNDIRLLHGNCITEGGVSIAGTRGWDSDDPELASEKIKLRELRLLERALGCIPPDSQARIVLLHYPPFDASGEPNEFDKAIRSHGADAVVFGHIHGAPCPEGLLNGIDYRLVSADHVGFAPVLIYPFRSTIPGR